ncbi:MAG TPA: serine hydrolase [Steroidobacteraceae bacterium]|jgi:CubicO group peptidase (beta-lactamase class C family)|nr:serine hydrolase [Steroidobacteraceae bacterium]
MWLRIAFAISVAVYCLTANPRSARAAPAELLPVQAFESDRALEAPVANGAFVPGENALPAPAFAGVLKIHASSMQTLPVLTQPLIQGRDVRIFPGVQLEFFTVGDVLVPVQRGEMVRETGAGAAHSYWRVIPQFGKVWREKGDGDWSRAAFPIMLVNDTENHAHQGLATFLYRSGQASALRFQFVQQTGPYLIKQYFVAWGYAPTEFAAGNSQQLEARRVQAQAELADRLPARPWSELVKTVPPGVLEGFGGPIYPKWQVAVALVRDGTLYYQDPITPYGPYPYPLEMRFGVRSVTKAVFAPLALLHLAQVYGPWVLTLKIGDYVPDLDPKWRRVRFVDASNMATGFGGMGSTKTHPNDIFDGYLGGDYDAWYMAPSHADKIRQMAATLHPYPWEPGTVMRYRDQDYYVLGAAIQSFLKSVRGPQADLGEMVQNEVFGPIGIHQAPVVRTREAGGRDGLVWCNAGYYPTLDDLAKIALLYESRGAHGGMQILNRELTADLLAARDAIVKNADAALGPVAAPLADSKEDGLYKMGFHFLRYVDTSGTVEYLPSMHGSGDNEVILYPNRMVSIVMAKASEEILGSEKTRSDEGPATIRAVERLAPF